MERFTAAFTGVCATSRQKWVFPSRSKRPPVNMVCFLVANLQFQNYPVPAIKVDERGELACPTGFMRKCHDTLELNVQTTGSYNSTSSGKVESPHKTLK